MTGDDPATSRTCACSAAPLDASLTDAAIYALLKTIFDDVLGGETIVLRPESRPDDVPGWDSYTMVNLIVEAERRFGFKARNSDFRNLKCAGDFVALISRALAEKTSPAPAGHE